MKDTSSEYKQFCFSKYERKRNIFINHFAVDSSQQTKKVSIVLGGLRIFIDIIFLLCNFDKT